MPTRLAFCITDLDAGGAEQALLELVIGLDPDEWEAHVFCLAGEGRLVDRLSKAQIPVNCLGARGAHSLWILAELAGQLRRLQPALLQTFLFHANIAGRLAGRLAGVQHIVSGIRVAEQRSRIPLWIDRWTNFLVEHNVCVSKAVAEFSIQTVGLQERKTSVIPNAVDVCRFSDAAAADFSEFGIPAGHQTIIAVGRLDPQKGPRFLLQAAERLIPEHPNLHFLFVGDGPLREQMTQWVHERTLQERIHFSGWRPDVPQIMRAATCLVLPSLWEGMPNVLLEAMAAALPVVATRVHGVEEIIQADETGILIAPQSVSELVSGINRLLADPGRASKIGDNAHHAVNDKFTNSKMIAAYCKLYRDLLTPDSRA